MAELLPLDISSPNSGFPHLNLCCLVLTGYNTVLHFAYIIHEFTEINWTGWTGWTPSFLGSARNFFFCQT